MIEKYIAFDLPSGTGGMAAGIYSGQVLKQIRSFSEQHNVEYRSKKLGYELRIWFGREEDYALFFLVYEPIKQWKAPKIRDGAYKVK